MKIDKDILLTGGLLEQYVLGELDENQSLIIEGYILKDPEVKAKFEEIETNFEKLAFENAITPPKIVKTQLLDNISEQKREVQQNSNSTSNHRFYFGVAASLTGFFLISSVWLYSELNSVKEELNVVKSQNNTLQNDLEEITNTYNETNIWYTALSSPDAQQYILEGNTLAPNAKIVSYVNHNDKSVIINTQQLPKLDDDHDYQMWADVDGIMINMGVIPKDKQLMSMTYIEHAESLNITIEPSGGNDHPTVERLISNVYIE